jgi:hypothetical protein
MFAGTTLLAYQPVKGSPGKIELYKFVTPGQRRGPAAAEWMKVDDSVIHVNGVAYDSSDYSFDPNRGWQRRISGNRTVGVTDKAVIDAMNKNWRSAP